MKAADSGMELSFEARAISERVEVHWHFCVEGGVLPGLVYRGCGETALRGPGSHSVTCKESRA